MLKTERMRQVVIAGASRHQRAVIEHLHSAQALHIEEHDPQGGDPFFTIGRPLPEGDAIARSLLRARGLQKSLGLEDAVAPYRLDDLDAAHAKVDEVHARVAKALDEQTRLEEELKELEARRARLQRVAPLGLRLEHLSGYRTLRVFVGTTTGDVEGAVAAITDRFEVVRARGDPTLVAVFVPLIEADRVEQAITGIGFSPIEVPEGVGPTETVIGQLSTTIGQTSDRLRKTSDAVRVVREEDGPDLLAAIQALEVASEKAGIPTSFAAGPTSFVVTGYVPASLTRDFERGVMAATDHRVHMEWHEPALGHQGHHAAHGGDAPHGAGHMDVETEAVADAHGHHESDPSDEPPIKYTHKSNGVKSFTMLLGMHSLPRYNELDPTWFMWLTFPIFFGMMIGDLGFGILTLLVAWFLRDHYVIGIGGPRVSRMLMLAGVWTVLFGTIMYGEAFGIHFVDEPGTLSWEWLLGADWSHMYASAVHLTAHAAETATGHGAAEGEHHAPHLVLFGFLQLGYYSKLHDVVTLLIISVGFAAVHLNLALLLGVRNAWVMHGAKHAIFGRFAWIVLQAGVAIVAWGSVHDDGTLTNTGWGVFVLAVVMLIIGEGAIAILELPKIFSNALSYTRLTAIGLSKAGMALAVNTFAFVELSPTNWALNGIGGAITLIVGTLIILALGILAGGIHAMRLQFVEFFGWFYEGGGREFRPFGSRRAD